MVARAKHQQLITVQCEGVAMTGMWLANGSWMDEVVGWSWWLEGEIRCSTPHLGHIPILEARFLMS